MKTIFKCNHCGHKQIVKNYNPLDLYDCKKCGKLTAFFKQKLKGDSNGKTKQ